MIWGFPLVLKGKNGQPLKPKPVNNAREDKLGTSFWRPSFERRRCLIPVSAWAEAEGIKGQMTRTWYSLAGADVFAVAGLWRPTEEWGAAYSMVMVDGCPQMAEVHDRMPVVLARESWEQWLAGMLRDDLRDQLFEALEIDCVRAKFCVAFLHDHTAYDDPEVFLICEAMKGFYCEILTRRRGEIQVTLRPPIIHEALGRAYDMLLSHQERVMEHDRTLQA